MGKKDDKHPKPGTVEQAVLAAVRKSGHSGITSQQLALQLGYKEKNQRYLVYDALEALQEKAQLKTGKKGRYHSTKQRDEAEGTIDIIASGAGYVRLGVATGKSTEDVFVHGSDTGMALHGDKVEVRISGGKGNRLEGKVLRVIERRRTEFVGVVHKHQGRLILVSDDQKVQKPFLIPSADENGAKEGDKAIVGLGEWKDGRDMPRAFVKRILGRAGEHNVEMHAILAEFGLPLEFPESVIQASKEIPDGCTPDEIKKRRDVRNIPTLTIDPDDAKDLDDALSLRKLESGNWEVGVHIADVSHYVRPNTVLDMEAAARATSVYLVDRVVPMLPEKLSNDLCSLHADSDKLSFSAIFELDEDAMIKGEWFGRTIMRSQQRFAYADAQAIIDAKAPADVKFKSEVLTLHKLAQVLRKSRMANGALEIGGNEVKFKLDEKGAPLSVYEKVMGSANWLIEEFMLLANKRVAAWVGTLKKGGVHPFVYRIHDTPDPEKVEQLRSLAKSFGHTLTATAEEDLPHAINRLLQEIKGSEEENIIKQITIRTMAKAIYSTDNIGHYGLGFEHYTHFTSPIRRYPDLLVHRAMAHYLAHGKPLDKETLETSCVHSSQQEKRASDAERASIKYKQSEYMLQRIGQTFEGIVSGLTNWGIYVEIRANKCEGMISLRDMPGDSFKFDQAKYTVIGQRTGKRIRLGDELQVKVRGVDMDKRTIDLAIMGIGAGSEMLRTSSPKASTDQPVAKPVSGPGKWDETRPQSYRESEPKSFGKNEKKRAQESRERKRRSLGKKKKR
ncbi:MAG: ribonuclease R [Flavobacteriales bacterium]|nr:ribonuclease R [Flavobacteriales bacterium]